MVKEFHYGNYVRDPYSQARVINKLILDELANGRPIYAKVPLGVYAGSIGRLKVKNTSFTKLSTIIVKDNGISYNQSTDRAKFNPDLTWVLELDDTNRTFDLHWKDLSDYRKKASTTLYIGRTGPTVTKKKIKVNPRALLVDFLGREICEGDYALVYSTYKELQDTGTPFRLARYTGNRSEKTATFIYIQMVGGKTEPGHKIRVNLNHTTNADLLYGVKVDMDESLATAIQMTDNDVGNFPIKFAVALQD